MKIIKNKIVLLLFFLLGTSSLAFSQKEVRKQLKAGNKEYKYERYTESEIAYRKALQANARSAESAFNLGDALYKQEKYPEAAEQYQLAIQELKDKTKLSSAWHNTGNIFMNQKDYAKSINAYKQALRNNPLDDETRYNLALAQKLLKDQQDQQNKDNKDNKDQNKDQNKDNKDQQKDQNKDQQQKDDKKDKTQEQPQQNEQMSKDNAQQILDALLQDEKNTQDKVKEAQMKQQERRKTDKNW